MLDDLEWLEQWYAAQCQGDWAEDRGVVIESLDNPGWMLRVDLRGTALEGRTTEALVHRSGEPPSEENGNLGGEEWMECSIKEGRFVGAGDPTKLRALLRCFRAWAEQE
ncbi:hypothetical protein BO221_26885 [Archangium sp. Cb G35]|uniref:immunity 53 family protein n=1 Tax=Archangium sp. Cb G35 TaxID=1920190 RepID=UPI0009376FC1|nr:hypothetical protein BO221_26885 [Archangium sp. Cb G35]